MTKTTALILFIFIALLGAGLAFGKESTPADAPVDSGKTLFETKCATCHPLARPLALNQDRAHWATDVTRMQRVNGCPITDEEAKLIVDYLVKVRGPAAHTGKK